jgi:hypothetical protein
VLPVKTVEGRPAYEDNGKLASRRSPEGLCLYYRTELIASESSALIDNMAEDGPQSAVLHKKVRPTNFSSLDYSQVPILP